MESFLWLLHQDCFQVDLNPRESIFSPKLSIGHAMVIQGTSSSLTLLREVLWSANTPHEIIEQVEGGTSTLLSRTMQSLMFRVLRGGLKLLENDTLPWRLLITKLVDCGSDVHHQRFLSPLEIFLPYFSGMREWYEWWDLGANRQREIFGAGFDIWKDEEESESIFRAWINRTHQELLDWWLNLLAEAGYNLHEHAHREESLNPCGTFRFNRLMGRYDLILCRRFIYGQKSRDLQIRWEETWIKRRGRVEPMPGSWDDNDSEYDIDCPKRSL